MEKIDERIPGIDLPLMSVSQTRGVIRRSELTDAPPRAESLDNYKVCRANDIVFNKMSIRAGAMGVAAEDGLVTYHYEVMRPREGTDPHFIAYLMKSSWFTEELIKRERGIGAGDQANVRTTEVPFSVLKTIDAYIPGYDEQRAIADYLDRETARIDTLIEEQQRLIEMLRERRAAVLSAAFDAGPSTEVTKVGRLLAARPSYGVLVPRYVDEAEGVPFVRVGDLLNLTPERPMLAIVPEQSDEYSRTKIVGGEVLLGVVGKMGQAALAPHWLAGANVARAVAVLRCKDPAVAPLLCAWLGSNNFLYQAELATSGDSIQPTLGMKDLARFDINLPTDPNAAADLASRLAKIDTLITETKRFIELSKERRAALITAAVTGQIDVREMA
ncbi:restriction endonuclease subunit S [Amycolatopsis carbonis]|uniref:Restriction endonuclease subunit S n=1 Tax=Amycolatopsis carbonis TaxID=715471 RepID=A0A9Y2MVW8_9PSEU|nr:restriction endonuclease subunit S [Amycolatopsis sp. 2-15]WIX83320.1 restriction endonuclease subunit S [Amycolatopsis sp. 2-15]